MLKINLLPKSLEIARKRNIAIGVVTLLVAAEVGGLLYMRVAPQQLNEQLTARKAQAEGEKAELEQLSQEANAVLAKEAALAPKFDFIKNTLEYNKVFPKLYRSTAAYTFSEATLLNLQASANQLTFDAYVSNPTDVSRLMLGLSRNPNFQGLPVVTGVPGWDAAEQAQRAREEQAQANQENLPGSSVIGGIPGAAPGLDGGGAYPGGSMGAYPGGSMGSAGGYPGGSMGSAGGYPGGSMGAPGMAMGPGGYPGGGGSMGGYPGGGGQGGGGGDISKFDIANAKIKPRGFTVNVTCLLTTPVMPMPTYANSAEQAGAGGGGGMGGYPGGGSMGGGSMGYPGGGGSMGPPTGYPGG